MSRCIQLILLGVLVVCSHFFPQVATYAWGYAAVLYWAMMYLTHHYLIDNVGVSCLAIAFFYRFLPDGPLATASPTGVLANGATHMDKAKDCTRLGAINSTQDGAIGDTRDDAIDGAQDGTMDSVMDDAQDGGVGDAMAAHKTTRWTM